MNILFLTSTYPNYVPDLLLQGLRKILGDAVVDYPRKDVLYQGICGQPNLDPIPDFMPGDAAVDREDIEGKMSRGFYDFVICDIRAFNDRIGLLQQNACPLALLDGEDFPVKIKPGPYVILSSGTDGMDNSVPLQYCMPEELIAWIERFDGEPKTHSIGFMGSRGQHTPERNTMLDTLARTFPDSFINVWEVGNAPAFGRDDYYRNMQRCKIVLNLPGAGVNAFRYWENAACAALHASKRISFVVPNDFREGVEIMKFSSVHELACIVEQVLDDRLDWKGFGQRSRAWLRKHHTTQKRAEEVVMRLKAIFGA